MLTYDMSCHGEEPMYLYLYRCIKDDILRGVLHEGERLPSKRELAEHISISVLTIANAYDVLESEGYVYKVERSGVYVAKTTGNGTPIVYKAKSKIDVERSDKIANFPYSVWCKLMRKVICDYDTELLSRVPHGGAKVLREAIADFLYRYRGMSVNSDNIVIGAGAEYLYGLIAQLLGDKVFAIENPSYEKIKQVYLSHGVECVDIPTDIDGGISINDIDSRVGVLHVSPSHNFATGTITPAMKRLSYIKWAREKDRLIVEDDYDGEFRYVGKPIDTLYSLGKDSDRVIYLNTFSKTIAPSLRIGYMILPESLIGLYKRKLGFYSCTVPAFEQYVLAEFISEGYFERHLSRLRKNLK